MTPLVQLDFRLVQGDGWNMVFPITYALDGTPFPLTGYSADFSLRQNYGDPASMIAMTTSVPSVNGSTIAIVVAPGGVILSAIQPIVTPADTMLLVAMAGARQAKFYYTMRMIPPGGAPTTVTAGTWYVWART
jgi:hypothetical protein